MSYTPEEIHIRIEQELQRIASDVYDEFEPEEMDLHYNTARTEFISGHFDKFLNSKGRTFEGNMKYLHDIQVLVRTIEIDSFTLSEDEMYSELAFEGEQGYPLMYFVKASVTATETVGSCTKERSYIPVRVVDHIFADLLARNPFATSNRSLMAVVENDIMKVRVGKRFILQDLSLTYIYQPPDVSVILYQGDPNTGLDVLPEFAQDEVIKMTAQHMLVLVESRRAELEQGRTLNINR